MSIQILGVDTTAQFLRKKSAEVIAKAQFGIKESTFELEKQIKKSIAQGINASKAFDTGLLAKSPTAKIGILKGTVSSILNYAGHVEYGTSRMQARPHFRNTLSKNKLKIIAYVQSKIANI